MGLHDNTRRLFTMQKIGRGETVTLTIGDDISLRSIHWTSHGARPCRQPDACPYCLDPTTPGARDAIYAATWISQDHAARLLIFSPLAVPWAESLTDLQRRRTFWRRARTNNLLRSEDLGPAEFATPAAPLDQWLDTLFQTNKTRITQ